MRRKALYVIVIILSGLFLIGGEKAGAAMYYVDSSVADTNVASATPDFTTYDHTTFQTTGGSDSVFKTIADINAFSTLQPGDSVLFRKGQTWREQLTVPASGTSGNPITFGVFGVENEADPKIYGSTDISGEQGGYTWHESSTANVWYVKKDGGNPNLSDPLGYVWVDNSPYLVITMGTASPSRYWYGDNDSLGFHTIYIYSTADPNTKAVEISYRDSGIYINGKDYITLENLSFSYVGYSIPSNYYVGGAGIKIRNDSDYIVANNCTADYNHIGFSSWHGSIDVISNVTINNGDYNNNAQAGIIFQRIDTVNITDVTASNNGFGGISVSEVGGMVNISGGAYSNNGFTTTAGSGKMGVSISNGQSDLSSIRINNITANNNKVDNIYVYRCAGEISVTGSTANDSSTGRGIYVIGNLSDPQQTPNVVNITNNTFLGENLHGIVLHSSPGVTAFISGNTISSDNNTILVEDNQEAASIVIENNSMSKYYVDGGYALWVADSSNVEFRNNFLANRDNNNHGWGYGLIISSGGNPPHATHDVKVHNNIFYEIGSDARWMLSFRPGSGYDLDNIEIYNNVFSECKDTELYPSNDSVIYIENSGGGSIGDAKIKNNILSDCKTRMYRIAGSGQLNGSEEINYNLWSHNFTGEPIRYIDSYYSLSQWQEGISVLPGHDGNSVSGDPLFINTNGDYSSSDDFQLSYRSPAIDAGTDVSLTEDFDGNPIYGTPDTGAYEYQPPYTMGTHKIDVGAGARIYGDGKFRDLNTPNSNLADLSITPSGGIFSQTTSPIPAWLDIAVNTWLNDQKQWTESNADSAGLETDHSVGDLYANTDYIIAVTGMDATAAIYGINGTACNTIVTNRVCQSDSNGIINFRYTGGYDSAHTFNLTSF